jgi:hypothetical protein
MDQDHRSMTSVSHISILSAASGALYSPLHAAGRASPALSDGLDRLPPIQYRIGFRPPWFRPEA